MQHAPPIHKNSLPLRTSWHSPEQHNNDEHVTRTMLKRPAEPESIVKRLKLDQNGSYSSPFDFPQHGLSFPPPHPWPGRNWGFGVPGYEVIETYRTPNSWTTNHSSVQYLGQGTLHTSVCYQQLLQASSYPCEDATICVEEHDIEAYQANNSESYMETDVQLVCYGLLRDLELVELGFCPRGELYPQWDHSSNLLHEGQKVASFSARTMQILTALSTDTGVLLEFELAPAVRAPIPLTKTRSSEPTLYSVSSVLYGPRDAADDIGDWLDSIELYLQMPTFSNRDLPYYNPHRTLDGTSMTTSQLLGLWRAPESLEVDAHSTDSLDIFTTRTFEEAEQPSLIKSLLHRHQKQALTFMQGRECGWDLHDERGSSDLWQCRSDSFGREKFVDSLSGKSFFRPPEDFRGGLLADEMGLGKTLSLLSLIASGRYRPSRGSRDDRAHAVPLGATLVVVPLPLLQVWEKQIREHFQPNSIHSLLYYGTARRKCESFAGFDIVLITYNTVAKEWKSQKTKQAGEATPPLFQCTWHRIVLDEAHIIKNKDTDLAKAVSALNGERRWCITGTPIQNRSSDIYSLLRFLRVYPYNNFKTYEEAFVQPLKTGAADVSALRNLQKLVRTLAIRRPRAVIDLPLREDIRVEVIFNEDEARTYGEAKKGVIGIIEQAFADDEGHAGSSYINALQRINELLYICNHGVAPTRKGGPTRNIHEEDAGSVQREMDLLVAGDNANSSTCVNCGNDLCEEGDNEYLRVVHHKIQRAYPGLCNSCSIMTPSTPSSSELASPVYNPTVTQHSSSKVRALINQIQQAPTQDKCAVFSYWTSTLDLVGRALTDVGILHTRYDGSMSRNKRDSVLTSFVFGTDKVILVSISCGGQGLDLTAANHAFLIEPQWNPMLEEQALSRVYRLGQEKPVRLVRFVVKGTWEEKIVLLQERKRMLAELIVDGPGEDAERFKGEEWRRQLAMLRDLVA